MKEVRHTPGPWRYGVREDGSIWMSLGDPKKGPHYQFDFYGTEQDAKLICLAPKLFTAVKAVLHDCPDLDMVPSNEPGREKQAFELAHDALDCVLNAYK